LSDSRRILDSVRRLVRLLRRSDRVAQTNVGLSAAQLFVLAELGKTPELSVTELADRTRTHQSSVSVVVSRLVDAGFVARERDSADARRVVLTLTRTGRAALQKAPEIAQERLIAIVDALPAAERKRFADTFETILSGVGESDDVPPMLFEDEKPRRRKAPAKRASNR
jgi:DNA-binding MarR family transcriptional regulator